MTLDDLQATLPDQDSFRRTFRKDEVVALLKGHFRQGRLPFIHQVTFPNGSQLRLKFFDTIKRIRNSKGQEVVGKESFLSYIEVIVAPAGQKAYCYTTDLNQILWAPSKIKAAEKQATVLANLAAQAEALGISLDAPEAWSTTYQETY